MKMKWLLTMGLVCLLAVSLIGCDRLPATGSTATTSTPAVPIVTKGGAVVVEGNIVPRDFTRVYTRTGGKVQDVLVKEGDIVAKDAVIVRLEGQEQAQAALAAAQLEKLDAQQALDKLNENSPTLSNQAMKTLDEASRGLIDAQQKLADFNTETFQTDLGTARSDAAKAKSDLKDAQDEWDKVKDLDPGDSTRKSAKTKLEDQQKKYDDAMRKVDRMENDLNQLQAAVDLAKTRQDDAQREVDRTKNGAPNANDLALTQSRLTNATAQEKAAQKNLADLEVHAPFAGTVVELNVVQGTTTLPNQQLALIADLSELFVETNDLTEIDVVKVTEGQAATIKPDAMTDLALPASVEKIDLSSGKKGGDVTYTVRLKLEKTDPRLRWGMTVEVRFK